MLKFIDCELLNIYMDFRESISNCENLCDLKEWMFAEQVINYKELKRQQLYLLRYMPAYLIEYYWLYKKWLNELPDQLPIKLLSVGCGWMIDYFSLVFAIRDTQQKRSARYSGLDCVTWNRIPAKYPEVDRFIIRTSIESFVPDQNFTFNAVSFPRSFEEMDLESLLKFVENLFKANRQDRLVSVILMASTYLSHKKIHEKINGIEATMNEIGFDLVSESQMWMPHLNENLDHLVPGFNYSLEIKAFLNALHQRCPMRMLHRSTSETQCKQKLNRKPKSLNADVYYEIMIFRREMTETPD